jgi:hypothetical protein
MCNVNNIGSHSREREKEKWGKSHRMSWWDTQKLIKNMEISERDLARSIGNERNWMEMNETRHYSGETFVATLYSIIMPYKHTEWERGEERSQGRDDKMISFLIKLMLFILLTCRCCCRCRFPIFFSFSHRLLLYLHESERMISSTLNFFWRGNSNGKL